MRMAKGYMSYPEYQAVMADSNLRESRAVKLYLSKAKHYHTQCKLVQKVVAEHPNNLALQSEYRRLDESRVENVWLAVETAQAEKLQGWRYLEDGDDFVYTLLVKYQGDVAKYSWLEKTKVDYIEILTKEEQRQIKTGVM